MPRLRSLAFACLAHLVLASAAFAYTVGDTLTVIWKPLPNIPSFARPEDDLAVLANAPSNATGWSASIQVGQNVTPLPLVSATYQAAALRWDLQFHVPAGVPEELYDLNLTCSSCVPDRAQHAVKVLPVYKADFCFAQISDTHLPSHTFSSDGGFSTADTTGMADFDAVIDDLNLIHPEFILHTGDMVNEGELEDYLAMFEMGRSQQMINRLRDPMFLVAGNHDLGGWDPTPPPPGTARKAWWRTYGWKYLENPPAGDPRHTQDYSFDYGLFHGIGLEAYNNSGSYDDYRTDIWGLDSFTPDQLTWLNSDIASVPPGRFKLAFYHYDFGSAGADFSQINPAALGLNGAIWGHNHGVAEGARAAVPFNLGLRSVIDGRSFRVFHFANGVATPGPMHRAGGSSAVPTDSLTTAWSGPNDGSRARLTATVTNRFGEAWPCGRLVFYLTDHDSAFGATGGTIAQTQRQGSVIVVYVDASIPASGSLVVSVAPSQPASVPPGGGLGFLLDSPRPNPFRLEGGEASLRFAIRRAGRVRVQVYDLGGRLVATLADQDLPAGTHWAAWNGADQNGQRVRPGVYSVQLRAPEGSKRRKISVVR